MAHPQSSQISLNYKEIAEYSITSIAGIKKPAQFAHKIYSTFIYTSKSNTFIETSQYPTH
jgi:hypothetical protein